MDAEDVITKSEAEGVLRNSRRNFRLRPSSTAPASLLWAARTCHPLLPQRVVRSTRAWWCTDSLLCNMADVPIGFGVTARGTAECRRLETNQVVLFHEADIGEYIRREDRGQ
eukprot:gene56714-biopygen98742